MSGIFTDGNDARRERLRHAAKRWNIVNWARTLRFDARPSSALHGRVAVLARDGVRVRMCEDHDLPRTYVLIEGPQGVDASELPQRLPDARWYDAPIIALAIEPLPADALPLLAGALGGPGAPAGVCDCSEIAGRLIVEFRPDVTQPALVSRIVDVELQRLRAARRTQLLTPLPAHIVAAIAGEALQAPEIAPDRILESLLGLEHVE
ncbi:MAG TPA: hypothetical protein VIO32_03970 [Candidatus Baltobacteraceae bacterium]